MLPRRLGLCVSGLALLSLCGVAAAQQVRAAPPRLLAAFDATAGTLQQLALSSSDRGAVSFQVSLGGVPLRLTLTPHEVRAPGFVLLEQTAVGLIEHPRPPCVTYRGAVAGAPGARVAATVVDGAVEATIHLLVGVSDAGPETWVIQPVQRVDPSAGRSLHLVSRSRDAVPTSGFCGVSSSGIPGAGSATGVPDTTALCEIAIECDRDHYLANGSSVVQTQNDVTSILNQVDFLFDRDCSVNFTITTILVTTTSVYPGTYATPLLNQFQSQWNTVHAGIPRDVAHLFTARPFTTPVSGLAFVGTVCSPMIAYGLSETSFSTNFSSRVALTAHELGHNFSANHCDSAPTCNIMCSSIGGCSANLSGFTGPPASAISSYAFSAACLQLQLTAPVVTTVQPAVVSVFEPGPVQLQGSGLYGATGYSVGGQPFTSGFSVSGDTAMNITVPEATSFGPVDVTVTTPQGTSNVVQLSYGPTQPPKLRTTLWIPPTGGTAQVEFAGTPGDAWVLVLGLSNATVPFFGFDLLANPVVLTLGTFQGVAGREALAVPVPAGIGYVTLFSQIVAGSPAGAVSGVSNFSLTIAQ